MFASSTREQPGQGNAHDENILRDAVVYLSSNVFTFFFQACCLIQKKQSNRFLGFLQIRFRAPSLDDFGVQVINRFTQFGRSRQYGCLQPVLLCRFDILQFALQ